MHPYTASDLLHAQAYSGHILMPTPHLASRPDAADAPSPSPSLTQALALTLALALALAIALTRPDAADAPPLLVGSTTELVFTVDGLP